MGAKRGPLAGHLQARSGSPLAALPHPGCPGCHGCPGRPLENEIPCGRPSHWKAALLAGGPVTGQARSPLAHGRCKAIHWLGAKPAGACLVPCQDHQDTQDTQEGVAGAKRGPLAGHLQARSGSPLAALPHPGCPGCHGCPGRPPSNGIPCGRPSNWDVAFPLRAAQPSNNFQKFSSNTPLRVVRGFAILRASADGPGSRKERDDLVFLGG